MYAIRTTPGFIIDSRAYGEAGKLISIFTRDLGLISASAVGIRFERSKLRYHAQDYSFGSFSLVRGKEFWRLTSASDSLVIPAKAGIHGDTIESSRKTLDPRFRGDDKLADELIARIALLLRRLLQGEEPNPGLFACVESAVRFIHGHDDSNALNEEQLKTLESLIVIRIMHRLGYIGDLDDLNDSIATLELSGQLLDSLKEKRISMNRHINQALKESHL